MDNVKTKYSRQQAVKLSGSTASRLSYLDRVGLVCPERIGKEGTKRPVVLYTKAQIEQIKIVDRAAKFLNLEGIRAAIQKRRLPEVVETVSKLIG